MGRNSAKRKVKKLEKQLESKGLKEADEQKSSGAAGDWKAKGSAAFVQQKYADAITFFTKAIEADEKQHALYSNRSASYAALKDFDNALKDAQKCVDLAPTWGKGHLRKAEALSGALSYQEAHQAVRDGLQACPDDQLLKDFLKYLEDLLSELKITEAQLAQDANPEADKFNTMVKWMKDNGAKLPMLYLQHYSDDYRGVHALTKIATGTVILYVPKKLIMTSEVARESDIGKKIIDSGVDLRSKHSYLAAYLCQERHNPDSFWKPYMDILPQKYRNMPIFFSDEEMKMLKGSFTHDKILDRKKSLKDEYDAICRAVPEFKKYTHWEFVWARLVVITRIFGIVIKEHKTDGLVPYADMLNHKQPKETSWTFDDKVDGFTITSLNSLSRGAEVFDSYGRKCNSRFFVNYGFALEDNEDNEVVIRLTLPKMDPHYQMKTRFLGGAHNSNREYQVPANYREKKSKDMFAFLRFANARDNELTMLPQDHTKMDEIEPISVRNEIAVLKQLKQAAQAVLGEYDTDIKEDAAILEKYRKGPIDDWNVRNCVVQRHGEKQVLHWYMDLCDRASEMLKMPWKDLKRQAAKCYQGTTPFDIYVTSVVVPLTKNKQ